MEKIVKEAIEQYEFRNPKLEFIRHNENITYKVIDEYDNYVMRVHKPVEGFSLGILQNDSNMSEYIESEMQLLNYFEKQMSTVIQEPLKNKFGNLVSVLKDGTFATVLKWVEGDAINNIQVSNEVGERIGNMIAKLHICSKSLEFDKTISNHDIKRYKYNQAMLSRIDEEFNDIIRLEHIEKEKVMIMKDALAIIKRVMDELDSEQGSSGVIHADLSPSNLILSNTQIVPIDFSLSGTGFYYMDIGLMVSHFSDRELRKSIVNGYEEIMKRKIPLNYIEAFFTLGIFLFIACQHGKVYNQDWFNGALEHWCKTIFIPLINGDSFVYKQD